jgi:hypothetical protein
MIGSFVNRLWHEREASRGAPFEASLSAAAGLAVQGRRIRRID